MEDQQHGEEHMCGQLRTAMYGTRDVAQIWQRECSETAREIGFASGKVPPCHFASSMCDADMRASSQRASFMQMSGAMSDNSTGGGTHIQARARQTGVGRGGTSERKPRSAPASDGCCHVQGRGSKVHSPRTRPARHSVRCEGGAAWDVKVLPERSILVRTGWQVSERWLRRVAHMFRPVGTTP